MKKAMVLVSMLALASALLVGCTGEASSSATSLASSSTGISSSETSSVETSSTAAGSTSISGTANEDIALMQKLLGLPLLETSIEDPTSYTGTSTATYEKIVSYFEGVLAEYNGDGTVTSNDTSGAEAWMWDGTGGTNGRTLSISVVTNPMGEGYQILVEFL